MKRLTIKYLRSVAESWGLDHYNFVRDRDDQPYMCLQVYRINGKRYYLVSIKQGDILKIRTVEELQSLLKGLQFDIK